MIKKGLPWCAPWIVSQDVKNGDLLDKLWTLMNETVILYPIRGQIYAELPRQRR